MSSDDKLSASIEDLPYFAEKYPGKVCCFCNLGERSSLGQGEFIRIATTEKNIEEALHIEKNNSLQISDSLSNEEMTQISYRRPKANSKSKTLPSNECINELDKIGYYDSLTAINSLLDGTYLYVHHMCAMWSSGIIIDDDKKIQNIELITAKSLKTQCSFCNTFGASVSCKMSCKKIFHLPCAAASGALLLISKFALFCVDHIKQAPLVYSDSNIVCQQCSCSGELSKLVMCCTCGCHYHTTCVGLANQPDTKSGWNCSQCSRCQICRQHDSNEGRTVICEQCQKVYHATCLRPTISSIPKYGWKCNRCRICTDCGSRTPGAGTSSRWHCHYTICDSCYQQRNKGFSCPVCHRAYRAAAHKEMVKCSSCNRFVHGTCDNDAELSTYHKRKESNPDYDYVCPKCISNDRKYDLSNPAHFSGDNDKTSPFLKLSSDSQKNWENDFLDRTDDENLIEDSTKTQKKRIGYKEMNRRGGKSCLMRTNPLSQLGRKRAKGKNGNVLTSNTSYQMSGEDRGSVRMNDDDLAIEKQIVLCSSKDEYMLTQDICAMCGAIGIGKDGALIACVQCGQCFHPYCVNVKLSKVIIEKGWRCLDCTICEGCGERNDESRLLLCDECDISYHIYCISPPLASVPQGNWKCKWCAICQKCGRNSPGKNSEWANGFLECGPCASETVCCICSEAYVENDFLIKCTNCERWLHCHCDSIKSEEEAQFIETIEYHCKLCRPKDKSLSYLIASKTINNSKADVSTKTGQHSSSNSKLNTSLDRTSSCGTEDHDSSENLHWVDGVCINDRGLNLIKSLTTEIKKKRRVRSSNEVQKDGILATIESVVSGSLSSGLTDNGELGLTESNQNNDNFKDGMIWNGDSSETPPGFCVKTNEEGLNILRKKRQRNLQKLGIGGFNIRNRALKKESEDKATLTPGNTSNLETDKKKKVLKKKGKSKLSETYPTYLQEAFFGKELLSTKDIDTTFMCESESSDELFDDLEFEQCIKTEESSTVTHSKTTQHSEDENNAYDKSPSNRELGTSLISPNLIKSPDNNLGYSNSTDNLRKSSAPPQSLPFFTEDMIKSEPLENVQILDNSVSSADHIPFESSNDEMRSAHKTTQHINEQIGPLIKALPSENICMKTEYNNDDKIEIKLETPNQEHLYNENLPVQNQMSNSLQLQNDEQHLLIVQDYYSNINFNNVNNNIGQVSHIPQEDKLFVKQGEKMMDETNDTSHITSNEPVEGTVAGTQKTAEKMRRDEELGSMATISAVLYSNTQHPELKQIYPIWTDRCKQILKRWRSLSTEKKAPFLQKAKDNRSALRLRRTQQEHEKSDAQNKVLKEQEQERVWKLHQAKIKEISTEEPKIEIKMNDVPYNEEKSSPKCSFMNKSDFGSIQANNPAATSTENSTIQIFHTNLCADETKGSTTEKGNKQLRTLLQKQPSATTVYVSADKVKDNLMSTERNVDFEHKIGISEICDPASANPSLSITTKKGLIMSTTPTIKEEPRFINDSPRPKHGAQISDCSESTVNETDKLDHDAENAGFVDILGGFGEADDDDLLKSLTTEMGDDFNILEYADPELDALANSQNLLSKLDFDDGTNNN